MALYWARVFFLMILCIRLGKNFLYYHYELLWTSLACCMRIPCTMGWAYESAVRQFSYFYHAVLKQQQERRGRLFWPYLIPVTFQSSSWTELTGQTVRNILWNLWCLSSVFNDVKYTDYWYSLSPNSSPAWIPGSLDLGILGLGPSQTQSVRLAAQQGRR